MKVKYKHFRGILYRDRLPRKVKKSILGLRISTCALKRKIKAFETISPAILWWGRPETNMATFCPYCGCNAEGAVDHHVPYPEVWIDYYCYRCKAVVARVDNSAYHHILEYWDKTRNEAIW